MLRRTVTRFGTPGRQRGGAPAVHAPRYLAFLDSAWTQWLALDPAHEERQPFPSVWPVRTLRSDVEPANFTACLGLYSMDNGSPLRRALGGREGRGGCGDERGRVCCPRGVRSVFCVTRPPGHHAGTDFMGGYCFINNAAVAAQALLDRGCAGGVLDVDYHHGNGTQSIFYERPEVLFGQHPRRSAHRVPVLPRPRGRDRRGPGRAST